MSLSTQILLGLVLGVAMGLLVGEPAGTLAIVGDAYVGLLQMTVLPYVMASLVAGLGSLTFSEARALALRGGGLLALLWGVTFLIVILMPLSFPSLTTASFFSTALVERPTELDVVSVYVPSNPFHSLANSDVPAVVLFSIAVGIALMGVERKESLIRGLHVLSEALMRVTHWIVRLTPYGVFAIGASAAGTMTVEDFGKVQVYLFSYMAMSLLLTLWVLPGLVTALTGLPHRRIIGASRDALITAFATGSDFVVLPILTERCKELLKEHRLDADDSDAIVDVVIPVSHNFPHTAKILTLSFVVFAGWFTGNALSPTDYPLLGGAGILSTFGSVNIAIPFLLDLFHVPQDLFNLFVATSVVNARFGTLLASMHGFSLALLATCALTAKLSFSPRRLLRFGLVTLALVAGSTLGLRVLLGEIVDTEYHQGEVLAHMPLALDEAEEVIVHPVDEPPAPRVLRGGSRIIDVLESDRLRVCYFQRRSLPFAYRDDHDRLVGFDVEMMNSLSLGLGVALELVPIVRPDGEDSLGVALDEGYCDITAGLAVSMGQSRWLDYSRPYLDVTMALMVRDHRRGEFADLHEIRRMRGLRLGVPPSPYYQRRVRTLLPNAEIIEVSNPEQLFAGRGPEVDALVTAAEAASAWSLLHPSWGVVVPDPPLQKIPLAFGVPEGDTAWANYVDSWIELKRKDGTLGLLYDHWILGRGAAPSRPRWSVLRDVLGWID